MDRKAALARLLLDLASKTITAKERPVTVFESVFWDIREKIHAVQDKLVKLAVVKLRTKVETDLAEKGYEVLEVSPKLDKFHGSYFITSCRVVVRGGGNLEEYLRSAYSPKFRLKETVEGISTYNVR